MIVTCGLLLLCYSAMSGWCLYGCSGEMRGAVITENLTLVGMRIIIYLISLSG